MLSALQCIVQCSAVKYLYSSPCHAQTNQVDSDRSEENLVSGSAAGKEDPWKMYSGFKKTGTIEVAQSVSKLGWNFKQ